MTAYITVSVLFAVVVFSPIEMTIVLLILFGLFQPTFSRFFAATVFSIVVFCHYYADISGYFDNKSYYLYACLADMLTIVLTSGIRKIPEMVINLQRICLGFVLVNGFGLVNEIMPWVPWLHEGGHNSMSMLVYNYGAAVLYFLTLLVFISRKENENERGNSSGNLSDCFHYNFRSLIHCLSGHIKKI